MMVKEFKRGLIDENPILVLALGLCPSMAISTSTENGFGMGIAVTIVLVCSNTIISLLRKLIPDNVRIPCFIIVIATLVTIVQLVMKAYLPTLDRQLGIFVPLIVVNCIILARVEAYASNNNVFKSAVDGIVMGIGFTFSLCIIGGIREIAGSNRLLGLRFMPGYEPMTIFILAPGGFFTIALLMGIVKYLGNRRKDRT